MAVWHDVQDDIPAHAGPDPDVIEMQADKAYDSDVAALVEVLRTAIETREASMPSWEKRHWRELSPTLTVARHTLDVLHGGPQLCGDQYVADVHARYGEGAVFHALSLAVRRHEQGVPRPDGDR